MSTVSRQAAHPRFRVGNWTVEPARDRLSNGERSVSVRPKVMDMLVAFAHEPAKVFTVKDLLDIVWPDTVTSPASVYNCLKELRAALNDDPHAPRYIETIPKRGYRLIAPVRSITSPDSISKGPDPSVLPDKRAFAHRKWWRLSARSALALMLVMLLGALAIGRSLKTGPSPESRADWQYVAVLPLEDLSANGSLENLGDGLARDIIGFLSRNPGLRVISYESSLRFDSGDDGLQSIGHRLGADLLVTGNMKPAGDRVLLHLRMTDTDDGQETWSLDLSMPTTPTLESDHQLGEAIGIVFQGDIEPIRDSPEPVPRMLDNRFYERFLRARRMVADGQKSALIEALELLDPVLQAETTFARAQSLALDARSRLLVRYSETWPTGQLTDAASSLAYRHGLESEAKILAITYPTLAEAHLLLGRMKRWSGHYTEARESLERALELNPSLGEAHRELGWLSHNLHGSWAQTVDHFSKAVALNPYSLELRMLLVRGLSMISARREEMWTILRETKESMAWTPDVSFSEAVALASEGRFAEAIRVLEGSLEQADDPRILSSLAGKWYALDRPERSRQLVPDFESWRDQADPRSVDPVNRCPPDAAGVDAAILLWAAYVCAEKRKPAITRQLLEARFDGPDGLANDPESLLGSEYSSALLMAWALKEAGDTRNAERYANIEERIINNRSENGKLRSGDYFYLKARLAAIRGDAAETIKCLDRMLALGKLGPGAVGHPVFDAYRDTPEFQSLLARRSVLVAAQLAQLGLPSSEENAEEQLR